jgi:hypothetical protein
MATGDGDISGESTVVGNVVTLGTDYITKEAIEIHLNGIKLEKGVQAIYSSGKLSINIPMDPGDRLIVRSEESI